MCLVPLNEEHPVKKLAIRSNVTLVSDGLSPNLSPSDCIISISRVTSTDKKLTFACKEQNMDWRSGAVWNLKDLRWPVRYRIIGEIVFGSAQFFLVSLFCSCQTDFCDCENVINDGVMGRWNACVGVIAGWSETEGTPLVLLRTLASALAKWLISDSPVTVVFSSSASLYSYSSNCKNSSPAINKNADAPTTGFAFNILKSRVAWPMPARSYVLRGGFCP